MSNKTAARVALVATALTTAYSSGWTSAKIDLTGGDFARLFFTYVHDDATSIEWYVEVSADGGVTWFDDHKIVGGTGSLNEQTFASASASFSHSLAVEDFNAIRVRAKHTGGSGSNTLALQYASGTAGR